MKKDSYVIIFYFLYFSWLFFITYLTAKIDILNYFTFSVVAFYFLFLREGSDFFWFFLASTVFLLFTKNHSKREIWNKQKWLWSSQKHSKIGPKADYLMTWILITRIIPNQL